MELEPNLQAHLWLFSTIIARRNAQARKRAFGAVIMAEAEYFGGPSARLNGATGGDDEIGFFNQAAEVLRMQFDPHDLFGGVLQLPQGELLSHQVK